MEERQRAQYTKAEKSHDHWSFSLAKNSAVFADDLQFLGLRTDSAMIRLHLLL